jgi:nucleotide-binding universal stress UspA family protein
LFDSELALITVLPESERELKPVGALTHADAAGVPATSPPKDKASTKSEGARYLERVAAELEGAGVRTTSTAIENPDAASEIVLTARDCGAQLIVMASRGRSGIVRGLLGSVTDRVIHSSPMPVIVVPAENEHDVNQWTPRCLIVPLDGSELAETALPHVEAIASVANIPVTLVRSVPFPVTYGANVYGSMSPGLLAGVEDDDKAARRYLAETATRLRARGHVVGTHVSTGHPRTEIAELAQRMDGAMVVMTTRGASGLTRWVVGSVTDSVIRSSGVPVLVIPPGTGH